MDAVYATHGGPIFRSNLHWRQQSSSGLVDLRDRLRMRGYLRANFVPEGCKSRLRLLVGGAGRPMGGISTVPRAPTALQPTLVEALIFTYSSQEHKFTSGNLSSRISPAGLEVSFRLGSKVTIIPRTSVTRFRQPL